MPTSANFHMISPFNGGAVIDIHGTVIGIRGAMCQGEALALVDPGFTKVIVTSPSSFLMKRSSTPAGVRPGSAMAC